MTTLQRLAFGILLIQVAIWGSVSTSAADGLQVLSPPPEPFFDLVRSRDRDAARAFYKKYLDVSGIPVVAAGEVADEALLRTHEIVSHMLAGRPDIIEAMMNRDMYLIIIGKDQLTPICRNTATGRTPNT